MSAVQLEVPPPGAAVSNSSGLSSDGRRLVDQTLIRRRSARAAQWGLDDVMKVLRDDDEVQEINMEQIERVRAIHKQFRDGSKFSFNYNTMLLVASVLAGIGLISNSSATIIASMLVSPIMGPVTGMAYGATICDWSLCKRALKTELISLLFCIFVGVVICSCTGPLAIAAKWPTFEMYIRGTWQNVLVALPVAFFSGMGVAVSILDDQTSSLVGVAISASLLPPAVNAGILWVAWAFDQNELLGTAEPALPINFPPIFTERTRSPTSAPTSAPSSAPSSSPTFFLTENMTDFPTDNATIFPSFFENATDVPSFLENATEAPSSIPIDQTRTLWEVPFRRRISQSGSPTNPPSNIVEVVIDEEPHGDDTDGDDDSLLDPDPKDYGVAGLASLTLTIANIILIILASVMMFRLKERLPIKKSIFWSDLGIARKIYRNLAVHSDEWFEQDEEGKGNGEAKEQENAEDEDAEVKA